MAPVTKAWIQIHLCVLLWGSTAVLGRMISLTALPLVWWRMVIVSAALFLAPRVWRGIRAMTPALRLAYAGIGCLLALHWITFYGSIKLSNASVGATCMAFGPVFLSVVEPWIVGRKFDPRELLLSVAVIPGVALVVGGVPPGMRIGILVGALSALFVAIFGALNKKLVTKGDAFSMSALELGCGALLVTLLVPLFPHTGPAFPVPNPRDAVLLTILAIACTLVPFTLSLVALRNLSAFGAQLAINLEVVYAALIAAALLGEHRELSPRFYLGALVIVGAVFLHPVLARRQASEARAI